MSLSSPLEAQHHGIETVYQDLALAQDLDGASNLFLGREALRPGILGWVGWLDKKAMQTRARQAFSELGVDLQNAEAAVSNLSGGQRQSVAVARSVAWASKVVFLDEPTAALGVVQTERVIDVIKRIRDRGIAVVLISHNMPQVLEVADRIEVLRLGTTGRAVLRRRGHRRAARRRHDRRPHSPQRRFAVTATTETPVVRRSTPRASRSGAARAAAQRQHAVDLLRTPRHHRGLLRDATDAVPHRLRGPYGGHQRRRTDGRVRRHDVRDHHRRHRPVGRLGAGVLRRDRGQGDELLGGGLKAGWGPILLGLLCALCGVALGSVQRAS